MVISSLNTKLLEDRLGYIAKSVGKLKVMASLPEERFLSGDTPAAAESYLRRCLEAMFDIGRHIIAKTAGKAEVEYKEVVARLREIGVITQAHAGSLTLMAGYRNRLVHFYSEVSETELHQIIRNNLGDIEEFLRQIAAFLEKYRTTDRDRI
jgi:uncharacterized protein YutE (UPF0331/DUF86 family)